MTIVLFVTIISLPVISLIFLLQQPFIEQVLIELLSRLYLENDQTILWVSTTIVLLNIAANLLINQIRLTNKHTQ